MKHLVSLFIATALGYAENPAVAQTNQSAARRWLEHAEPTPPFTIPTTKAGWEKQRKQVRTQLGELLGKLPPRPKVPKIETLAREDRGDYIQEKFQFDNGAGATVPGYLLLPKNGSGKAPASTGPELGGGAGGAEASGERPGAGTGGPARRRPAILYCHWHGGEYAIGKEELFQARHTPEAPGPAFAKRGFVVLAIDAYCFGERNGQGPGGEAEKDGAGEMTAAKFNLWVGRTLWGMILRDDLMALDYLASRPEVDARRIAVTGMSMGATRSWWLMALDERIQTGVAVACLTRYQNLIAREALYAHGIYYFVPNLLNHFDTEAVVSLLAPRPVLLMNGDQDSGSPVDGIHAIESVVRPAYALYGHAEDFQSVVYAGQGHVYTSEMWTKTLDWMDARLKK